MGHGRCLAGSAPRTSWYLSPLIRDTLIELNVRSDLLGVLQTAGSLAVLAGTGSLAAWSLGCLAWPVAVPCFRLGTLHKLIRDDLPPEPAWPVGDLAVDLGASPEEGSHLRVLRGASVPGMKRQPG